MGRRARACRGARGGDDIPALGARGLRLTSAAAALVLLGGLVVYPAAATDREVPVVAALGAASWVLLAVAILARWPTIAGWALAGFGAEYALYLRLGSGGVDTRAPFVAAGLIAAAEFAFQAIERSPGRADGRLVACSAGRLALLVVSTVVISEIVLVAAGSVRSNLFYEALGVGAAVVAVGLVFRIASRARESGGVATSSQP